MKIVKFIGTAIATSTIAGSAFAADLPSRREPVVVPPLALVTWTGFYAGVNAGAAFGNNSSSTFATPISNNPALAGAAVFQPTVDVTSTNIFGTSNVKAILGGQIGYNYQFANSYVVGIEADAQGLPSSRKASTVGTLVPIAGFPNALSAITTLSKRTDFIGTVRARLGYTITPGLLVYATGGLAYGGASSSTSIIDSVTGAGAVSTPFGTFGGKSTMLTGYVAGAGLEYLITPNWSVKLEGLYYDLGKSTYSTVLASNSAGVPFTADLITSRVKYNGEIVRAGLNYHFNWTPTPVIARY